MKEVKECRICINNTKNPSIKINDDGICNICEHYNKYFKRSDIETEKEFIKTFITNKKYDCMVGLSGGKDSSAMLYTVKELGFTPLAFSFKVGYNEMTKSVKEKINNITKCLGIDYQVININNYISDIDKQCFKQMSELYDEELTEKSKEKFREIYNEGRKYYSTKQQIVFPFVRPCQICRKIAIKAYYEEAVKRNIKVVFIGINEWASNKNNKYSAIRKLKPFENKPEVYIVHLPFLVGRKYEELPEILERIGWKREEGDHEVDTGGSACLLARACEKKANEIMGFHLDSARLAREITVGFIDKAKAIEAIKNGNRESEYTVKEVLKRGNII